MKVTMWLMGIALLATTALASYEFTYIYHLEFIIRLLTGGQTG